MKKIGIFYGTTTGTTETIANAVAEKLNVDSENVFDVSELTADLVAEYDVLLLGTSTWGEGELQDDWFDGVNVLKESDLSGKIVALFGCGDSEGHPDTFCDAIGVLYGELKDSGCTFIGSVPAGEYNYSTSVSVVDDKFVGLAIDEMSESDKTEDRINAWTEKLQTALA